MKEDHVLHKAGKREDSSWPAKTEKAHKEGFATLKERGLRGRRNHKTASAECETKTKEKRTRGWERERECRWKRKCCSHRNQRHRKGKTKNTYIFNHVSLHGGSEWSYSGKILHITNRLTSQQDWAWHLDFRYHRQHPLKYTSPTLQRSGKSSSWCGRITHLQQSWIRRVSLFKWPHF